MGHQQIPHSKDLSSFSNEIFNEHKTPAGGEGGRMTKMTSHLKVLKFALKGLKIQLGFLYLKEVNKHLKILRNQDNRGLGAACDCF